MTLIYILTVLAFIGLVIGIVKGLVNRLIGGIITLIIVALCGFAWYHHVETPQQFIEKLQEVLPKSIGHPKSEQPEAPVGENNSSGSNDIQPGGNTTETATPAPASGQILTGSEQSSTTIGNVNYGATFIMGDLDQYGRATYAHIRVTDAQEPGNNGVKRPERILTNPAGWSNPKRTNDRTHLVGYQFSGVNDDPRNLVTATAYLNRGVKKSGSNEKNPDGMLYYEQILDKWLRENPDNALDLYVQPNYDGTNPVPVSVTMRWVGVTPTNELIPIETGGHATSDGEMRTVTLENK